MITKYNIKCIERVDEIVSDVFERHQYKGIKYTTIIHIYIENPRILKLAFNVYDKDNEYDYNKPGSRSPQITDESSSIGLA